MNKIHVFGRPGSDYRKKIDEWLDKTPMNKAHFAINYGLQGEKLTAHLLAHRHLNNMPVLNKTQAGNKLDQVKIVAKTGEPVPDSWTPKEFREMGIKFKEGEFLVKPYYSLGGKGVKIWNGKAVRAQKYVQRRINNRRYEMRVHCFAWTDPDTWIFQKRVHEGGDDVVAWNHHNGGKFITVQDPTDPLHNRLRKSAQTIMKALGYQFGAVDYIIQNPGERGKKLKHYFIEWNLAPGWTLENTENYYKESFVSLKNIDIDHVYDMCDGVYAWDREGALAIGKKQKEAIDGLMRAIEQARQEPDPDELEDELDLEEELVDFDEEVRVRNDIVYQEDRMNAINFHENERLFCYVCGAPYEKVRFGNPVIFCMHCGVQLAEHPAAQNAAQGPF